MKNKVIILLILISAVLQIYTTKKTHYFSDELSTPFTWLELNLDYVEKDYDLAKFRNPENFSCGLIKHMKTSIEIHEQHHILPIYSTILCYLAKLTNAKDPLELGRFFNIFVYLIFLYLIFISPWKIKNLIHGLILMNTPIVNISYTFTRSYSLWITLIIFSYLVYMKSRTSKLGHISNIINMFVYPFTLLHIISQQMFFKVKKINYKWLFSSLILVILLSVTTQHLIDGMDHLKHLVSNPNQSRFFISTQRIGVFIANAFFDIRYFQSVHVYKNYLFMTIFFMFVLLCLYLLRKNKLNLLSFVLILISLYFVPVKLLDNTRYFSFIYIPFFFFIFSKVKKDYVLTIIVIMTLSYRFFITTKPNQYNFYLFWHHTKAVVEYLENREGQKTIIYTKSKGDLMDPSDNNMNLVGVYLAFADLVEIRFREDLNQVESTANFTSIVYDRNYRSDRCNPIVLDKFHICELSKISQ